MFNKRQRRYAALRKRWPDLFKNPPGAPYEILLNRADIKAAEKSAKRRLSSKGFPRSLGRTGVVYEDPYLIVMRDAVRFPAENLDGETHLGTYIRTMPPNGSAGAAALPFTGERILLLRHFRHATRSTHLEIPRGFAEPGMNSYDLAVKELEEEIKAEVDGLVELGYLHSNTGIAVDCVELFLARIRQFGQPQASEGIVGVELYTPLEVAELIRRSQITDSFTIAAFTRAWLANLLPGITSPIDVP